MKSFGIGLALLAGGFAAYVATILLNLSITFMKAFPEPPSQPVPWWAQGIWSGILLRTPYICIGIMVFGVVWYWIVEPILYLKRQGREK